MKKAIALLLLALASCGAPAKAYVEADRATFNAIAPEYRGYVDSDTSLTTEERNRRIRLIDSWNLRIQKAEVLDEPR